MKIRHTNIVASYLVLFRDGKILLSQRKNTGYRDGEHSVVAGHVEEGETFIQTIVREAKEEAGIVVRPKDLIVKHVQHCKSDSDASERVHIFFVTEVWKGEVLNMEPDKCGGLMWADPYHLPKKMVPHTRLAIECIMKEVFYSEQGWL